MFVKKVMHGFEYFWCPRTPLPDCMLKYKLKKLPPTTNSVVLYTFVELLTIKAINISNILNHNKVKKKKKHL